jgi:hypothetical protein
MTSTLIVSGCSVTEPFKMPGTWPTWLRDKMFLGAAIRNYGRRGAGNTWIARSLIYGIRRAVLEGTPPSNIVAIPMWSGIKRMDVWVDTVENKNHLAFGRTELAKPQFFEDALLPPEKRPVRQRGYVPSAEWKTPEVQNLMLPYMASVQTATGEFENTLHNMYMVEAACQSIGVPLIHLAFHDFTGVSKWSMPSRDLINWSLMCRQSLLPWALENNHPMRDSSHPAPETHKLFVDEFVEPLLTNLLTYRYGKSI